MIGMAWVRKRTRNSGVRWTGCYRDDRGRIRSAGTAPTKKAALQLAQAEEHSLTRGDWIDPGAGMRTFADYFAEWFEGRDLTLNGRMKYRSIYTAGLEPEFGQFALRDITTSGVQRWVNQMRNEGVSPVTIRDWFSLLHTVLAGRKGASALREELIRRDPCSGVTIPRVPRREVTVYTPEQADAAIVCLDQWWRELTLLLAETGCRWGEAQGLCVGDIWDNQVVIRRTIVQGRIRDTGTGTAYAVKEFPKNWKPRRLALSAGLVDSINQMVQRRNLSPGDRLFARADRMIKPNRRIALQPMRSEVWPNGVPVSRTHFRQVWRSACRDAGVPELRVYDLRASNISWMLAGGADIATVMQRAGHSQLATTQRYVSALEDADDRALDALATLRER